jgi:hypothetical protein
VIEEHQVSSFSAVGLNVIYIYTHCPAQAKDINFSDTYCWQKEYLLALVIQWISLKFLLQFEFVML